MKRAIITLTLLLGTFLCGSAQIQRTFFGFSLGKATKQEVSRHFKAKGKKVEYYQDACTVLNVRFAGWDWERVSFYFHKNKLYQILFTKTSSTIYRSSTEAAAQSLLNRLKTKYQNYYKNRGITTETEIFSDGTTGICLGIEEYDINLIGVCLSYIDIQLNNESFQEEDNEL